MSSTSRSSGERCSGTVDAAAAAAAAVEAAAEAFSMSTSEAIFVGFDFFRRFFEEEQVVDGVRENGDEFDWSKGFVVV